MKWIWVTFYFFSSLAFGEVKEACKEFPTGQNQILRHEGPVSSAQVSLDGKKVVTASADGTAKILDLETGEEKIIKHKGPVSSAQLSLDGKKLVTALADGPAKILNLETGEEKIIKYHSWAKYPQVSSDGKKLVTTLGDYTSSVSILDLETGEEKIIIQGQRVRSAQVSPDGKKLVTVLGDSTAKILDLETEEEKVIIRHGDWLRAAQVSSDGKKLVTTSENYTVKVLDLETGKQKIMKDSVWVGSTQVSPDGKKLVIGLSGTVQVIDLKTTCVYDTFHMVEESGCDFDSIAPIENLFEEIKFKNLCDGDFDQALWDLVTPLPKQNEISIKDARNYLLRFQKPGGFEPEKHLPILLAMIRSDIPELNPNLMAATLQNVLSVSNALYEDLLLNYPKLRHLSPRGSWVYVPQREKEAFNPRAPGDCVAQKEKEALKEAARDYFKYLKAKNPQRTMLIDWGNLRPLSPLLAQLSPEQKEEYIHHITLTMADHAADSYNLNGIFHSKLYKFSKQAVLPLFGEEQKPLTDLTLVRGSEGSLIQPMILGLQPIDGREDTGTAYGFYVKKLDRIAIPTNVEENKTLFDQTISWKDGEKPYSAKVLIQAKEGTKNIVPNTASPNYDELWKDQALTGIVVAGANLKGDASGVMDEYLNYFLKQGFQFPEKEEGTKDLEKLLRDKISEGEVDYFIKEAHSDGDEKNLFRIDRKASYTIGRRKLPDGKKEIIYLVYPSSSWEESKLISNQDFGRWIQERGKREGGPLVYFNTSCWSCDKAILEVEAAQSSLLVNIPTISSASIFSDSPYSAEYQLITSFRERKTYEQIREAMKKNPKYEKRISNLFIFPDEEAYDTYVRRFLTTPLDIQIAIQDDQGNPYNIDQFH